MNSPTNPHEQLLTIKQVADALQASVKTIQRRIKAGKLPAVRDGRIVRVRPEDLRIYIAARRRDWPSVSSKDQ